MGRDNEEAIAQCLLALGHVRSSAYACIVARTDGEEALTWAGEIVLAQLAEGAANDACRGVDDVKDELVLLCEVASILAEACRRYSGEDEILASAGRNLAGDLQIARAALTSLERGRPTLESGVVKTVPVSTSEQAAESAADSERRSA